MRHATQGTCHAPATPETARGPEIRPSAAYHLAPRRAEWPRSTSTFVEAVTHLHRREEMRQGRPGPHRGSGPAGIPLVRTDRLASLDARVRAVPAGGGSFRRPGGGTARPLGAPKPSRIGESGGVEPGGVAPGAPPLAARCPRSRSGSIPASSARATVEAPARPLRLRRRKIAVGGEHHLWVEQCDWSLFEQEKELAHSESARAEISRALARLDGAILRSVRIAPGRGRCRFDFEFDISLRLERCSGFEPDHAIWHLYAHGLVLSLLASGQLESGPGDDAQAVELVECEDLELAV